LDRFLGKYRYFILKERGAMSQGWRVTEAQESNTIRKALKERKGRFLETDTGARLLSLIHCLVAFFSPGAPTSLHPKLKILQLSRPSMRNPPARRSEPAQR
jgi:hypothetical protein